VTILPELLRIGDMQEWRMTFFGILLVVIMIVRPLGLIGARR
jgi:branched-chain amino acid transport system permease protein